MGRSYLSYKASAQEAAQNQQEEAQQQLSAQHQQAIAESQAAGGDPFASPAARASALRSAEYLKWLEANKKGKATPAKYSQFLDQAPIQRNPYSETPGYSPIPGELGSYANRPSRSGSISAALRNYLNQSQRQRAAQYADYRPFDRGGPTDGTVPTV